jgi:hypothetical protein
MVLLIIILIGHKVQHVLLLVLLVLLIVTILQKVTITENNNNDGSKIITRTTTIGQRHYSQINTLDDILDALQSYHNPNNNNKRQPIYVKNGYADTVSSSALIQWNDTIISHADEIT